MKWFRGWFRRLDTTRGETCRAALPITERTPSYDPPMTLP